MRRKVDNTIINKMESLGHNPVRLQEFLGKTVDEMFSEVFANKIGVPYLKAYKGIRQIFKDAKKEKQ